MGTLAELLKGSAGEPTYRMSMLPFGTYPNENGQGEHLGLAVPGMIQEPVNALMNLFAHGNFAKGPDYPGNADDMRTLLFSMYGGNALSPARAAEAVAPALLSDTGKPSLFGSTVAGAERPQGFDVWHGSPHNFDQFDISKIGTGEGAQVYGHGLYFAENPNVAKGYRDQLAGNHLADGTPLDFSNPDHVAASFLHDYGPDAAPRVLESDASLSPTQKAAVLERLSNPSEIPMISGDGYLYQSRINADPERFIDWDKPLADQSPIVRDAFARYGIGPTEQYEVLSNKIGGPSTTVTKPVDVSDAYSRLGAHDKASSVLRDAGIPGIRYLDQHSRGAGEGSRNYVLFSHDPVDIIHKWKGDQQLYSDQLPSLFGAALAPQDQNQPTFSKLLLQRAGTM
jgi:hypothetical protein